MERFYRQWMRPPDLIQFRVVVGETDLWVAAAIDLSDAVRERVKFRRRELRAYLERDRGFEAALTPRPALPGAPAIVQWMTAAGAAVGVGPMAAVAGAIAQAVGLDLRDRCGGELLIENGGDIYLQSAKPRTIAVYAGDSPISGRLGIVLPPCPDGFSVCTSAGSVGPSLSLGLGDAATILAQDAALADAAATALGNRLQEARNLERAVSWVVSIPGIAGALAIIGDRLAAAGQIELTPLCDNRPEDIQSAD